MEAWAEQMLAEHLKGLCGNYPGSRRRVHETVAASGYNLEETIKALKREHATGGYTTRGGSIDFNAKGIVIQRYGSTEEQRISWPKVARILINILKEETEAEAFEDRPSKSQARGRGKTSEKRREMTMTTLANREETRTLTLADYEARIHIYKEQIGTGYIGIGRTLTEAKQAGVVPHGEWERWVTRTTGLNPRQAQRCMQAAAEIREGSALARLEMSKALMLLSSGLDEETREEVAGKAAEDGATVRQLKAEIQRIRTEKDGALAEAERIRQAKDREDAENAETVKALKLQVIQESGAAAEIRAALKKAEADRDALKGQLEATVSAYQKRMDEEAGNAYRRGLQDKAAGMEQDIRKEFQGRIDFLNGQKRQAEERVKDLQAELENSRKDGSQAWDKGYQAARNEIDLLSERYGELQKKQEEAQKEAESLRRNQGDLLAAAEEAEKRAADAEAELEALRAAGPEGKDPAWKVIKMAADRFRMECEMLPILDAPGVLRGEKQIAPCLDWMETWLGVMRETLAGAIQSEGAVL